MNHSFWWALSLLRLLGITDGLDGLIARLTRQKTELGAFLDPIADKLLLISAYLTLAIVEVLPGWLSVIVITRDVIIMLGILVIMLISHPPRIRPSFHQQGDHHISDHHRSSGLNDRARSSFQEPDLHSHLWNDLTDHPLWNPLHLSGNTNSEPKEIDTNHLKEKKRCQLSQK